MSKLTTLLFDVDGTLAETEEIHRQSFNRSFTQEGLDWHWSQQMYAELLAVTGGKERIRYYLANHQPEFTVSGDLDEYIAALHASKTVIYTETMAAGNVPMRPGIKRLINEARQSGLRLGIATTTTPANVSALLQHNLAPDAESWFEVIAAGGVVPAKKPAPDIYHYAMQAMGVSPAECLAFEDSENGLRSARAAELQTLVTVSEYTREHNFDAAALVLDQLGEPGSPFQVISGAAGLHRMVTVELLQELCP
ncbi:MAG: HAD family hydrolase [Gammaproteobacteria bacterium]|nr:MAG: HAD family hydrolase [Gammaproteobacteria bacterium]